MNHLMQRWKTQEGMRLSEEVLARLMGGRPLSDLRLSSHEGRIDLRYLPAPEPRRLQRFETDGWFVEQLGGLLRFQGVHLEGLDLTGALLRSMRFHQCQITHCRFDGANCEDWRLWGTDVSDCSFVGANMREAVPGTWHEGQRDSWRRVDFSESDFRVISPIMALFEDCDFSNAKLDKVKFGQCTLVRCRFAGPLVGVAFDGRELKDRPAPPQLQEVDFKAAVFQEVDFMGFDLERVTLPDDPALRLVRNYRCVMERGLRALEGDESLLANKLRAQFKNRLRGMRADYEANVFNLRDHFSRGGEEQAVFADKVLRRAEQDCSDS